MALSLTNTPTVVYGATQPDPAQIITLLDEIVTALETDGTALDTRMDAVEAIVKAPTVSSEVGLGGAPFPDGTSTASKSTYVFDSAVANAGTVTAFHIYSAGAATIRVGVFSKSGNDFTREQDVEISVAAGASSTTVSLPVAAGEYLGFYTPNGAARKDNTRSAEATAFFSSGGSDSAAFTDAGASTSTLIMVGFSVSAPSSAGDLDDRVATLESVADAGAALPFENMFWVGAGQSLMAGIVASAGEPELTTTQEFGALAFPARGDGSISAATVSNSSSGSRGEWPLLGGAAALRGALKRDLGIAEDTITNNIIIANDGVSGASISSLSQGTSSYNDIVDQATALASLTTGTSGVLAVAFAQGEADGGTDPTVYKQAVIDLAADFDTDLRAETGQHRRIPFVLYQVASVARSTALAQLSASLESDLVCLSHPMYSLDYYDDKHVTAESSRLIGAYFAEATKVVAIDGLGFEPLRPIGASVLGNTITLTMNKSGLVLDTTLMPPQTNSGFTVEDDSDVLQTISSVAVANGNQVKITCATTPGDGWTVKYGDINVTGKSPFVGGGGNLRDSAGADRTFDAVPLHNWCVLFDWSL